MSLVVVSLGSNLNQPVNQLETAIRRLEATFSRVQHSSFYLTDPVDGPAQPDYVNACATFETNLPPDALLKKLQIIEIENGRTRDGRRNQPRTLDIDIILYDDLIRDANGLMLPHPRFRDRRFVLAPLAELVPDLADPVTGRSIEELLQRCPDEHRVELLEQHISA